MAWLGGSTGLPDLDRLTQGGPRTNTQPVFGGDVGLSPQAKALWDFAMRQRLDPMSSIGFNPAVLLGPGAAQFRQLIPPRVGAFLENMPEYIRINSPMKQKATGLVGEFAPTGLTDYLGKLRWTRSEPDTALHEVLHALYERKGLGGYPPVQYADQIASAMLNKDPRVMDLAFPYLAGEPKRLYSNREIVGEMAIEGMARNMLRKLR